MAESGSITPSDADYVVTIDDTSPTIVYSPFADTFGVPDFAAGWNPLNLDSGLIPGSANATGARTSLHATAADGASVAVRWNGEYDCFIIFPCVFFAVSLCSLLDGMK
jgi:hypothetical protein